MQNPPQSEIRICIQDCGYVQTGKCWYERVQGKDVLPQDLLLGQHCRYGLLSLELAAQSSEKCIPTASMVEAAERLACENIPGMDPRVTLAAAIELRRTYENSQRGLPKHTEPEYSLEFQKELDHDNPPTLQERRQWRNAAEVGMREP